MLTKLCAMLLIVLAASPFTAPFQTCDFSDTPSGNTSEQAVIMTPPTVAQTSLSDDAALLVPTLTTTTGRLRLAPLSALAISNFVVAFSPVAFLAPPVAPSPDDGGASFPPTVLRV
jgi:hypothetical protein